MDLIKNNHQETEATFVRSVYNSMFNFTQDAISLLDTELNIIRANIPFMNIARNYSPSTEISHIFDLIRNEDDRRCFLSVIDDNIVSREITLDSLQEKEPCVLNIKLGPIKDNGRIIGAYAIFVDITDFRKRENELNRRFKLICNLVDNANLGIVIIGQDHKVIESNDRFCEMIGYSHEEITDLHSWDWEYLADENAIRKGFADLSEVRYTFDTIHKRKDGTTYHATVSASGADVFGDGNDVIMCISEDITAKKEMEEKLRLSETKFRTYLENAADMILTVDIDGKINYVSPNCERICGFNADEIINKRAADFFITEKTASEKDPFDTLFIDDNNNKYRSFKIMHRDGSFHWYGVTISKTSDVNGKDIIICNTRNIDESIEKEKKLEFLSLYDHLTGVPNKAFFDAMLKRAQTSAHRPLSLLVCDLDYLKTINDEHGHAKGDEILQKTAQLIQSSLRKADFISRVGGDEFAVILPGAGQKEAMSVVKRIYRTFKDHNSLKGALPFNISIGIATVNDPLTSLKDALNEADLNMYSRKHINKGELQR